MGLKAEHPRRNKRRLTRLMPKAIASCRFYPLSRYAGGGMGWGRFAIARKKSPPYPPPEYRERDKIPRREPLTRLTLSFLHLDGQQIQTRSDVKHPVGRDGGGIDRVLHID